MFVLQTQIYLHCVQVGMAQENLLLLNNHGDFHFYERFLKKVIGKADESDFPIVVQSKCPGIMDINQIWELENMLEKDTGLHVSLQCPTCSCCGAISMICIIYP